MKKISNGVIEIFNQTQKESQTQIESLNLTIKRLQDALNTEKKLSEEKNKEKQELHASKFELESKYDKLTREFKSKEREYVNNLNIEEQKYKKMENYYTNIIKEKDTTIANLENKVQKLNKEIAEMSKELSSKTLELNKENTKLSVELERFKGQEKKGKNEVMDSKSINLQSLFKTIQNIFMEFKESVDKLDREKENIFKTKFLELSTKEIEGKTRKWIEEITIFKEEQLKAICENYEKSIAKTKDELEECQFLLTKANFSKNEEEQLKETYKAKFEVKSLNILIGCQKRCSGICYDFNLQGLDY